MTLTGVQKLYMTPTGVQILGMSPTGVQKLLTISDRCAKIGQDTDSDMHTNIGCETDRCANIEPDTDSHGKIREGLILCLVVHQKPHQ